MNHAPEPRPPDADSPFLVRAEGPIRINGTTGDPSEAVSLGVEPESGPRKACPNHAGYWLYSPGLDTRLPRPCKAWSCPTCGKVKKAATRELLEVGMADAFDRFGIVRSVTLTAPGRGYMPLDALSYGWRRFTRPYMRKRPDGSRQVEAYAAVVEFQKRGAPHIHALFAGPEFLPVEEIRRRAVGRNGSRGRFGPRVGIEAVGREDAKAVGGYLSKFEEMAADLAGYLSKGKAEGWHRDGRTRIRPVWSSRGWYPGGLTAAEEAVRIRWNGGESRPSTDDWRLERVDPATGVLTDLGPLRQGAVRPLPVRLPRAA